VVDGTGLSRGDRNRNGRLGRLRELLAVGNAVVGIDLAEMKQAVRICRRAPRTRSYAALRAGSRLGRVCAGEPDDRIRSGGSVRLPGRARFVDCGLEPQP
jgi:hypothetical protein